MLGMSGIVCGIKGPERQLVEIRHHSVDEIDALGKVDVKFLL